MSAIVLDLTARLTHRPPLAEQASRRIADALHRLGFPASLISQAEACATLTDAAVGSLNPQPQENR